MKLDKIKNYLESEEGKNKMDDYFNKIIFHRELKDKRVQKIHEKFGNNIEFLIDKVSKKYESDKYITKEYKLGYEPRKPLYFLLFEYANKYGEVCNDDDYINEFTSAAFYLGSYVIQLMQGQGSVIRIDKCLSRKRNLIINKIINE